MALVSGGSTLNPNAPLFIPAALRQVEDFSLNGGNWLPLPHDLLPETFDLDAGEDFTSLEAQFEEFLQLSQTESKTGLETSTAVLKNLKSLEDRRSPVEPRRYAEKPAKHVSPKCSPRFIQQPR
ncbi:protein EARLY RESPONSIVE TO DEHYDRATION 15 [Prunus yedoensis var. nudiflora]|uniref:Protein EARLY RESPONSIVE TO DEHYDRATION 15 n=1 Tax=Prunus yedoensis var. nudiflora TaxID=2094558 RepID=A0A314UB91_PRUYE|nr:protein EARLY RESPONSIVE TO DEHYDRATION 15 [Prunus yedoensis var. nudiflora]